MAEAFPLYWPDGWKRTRGARRVKSQFRKTTQAVKDYLYYEVERLGGRRLIISTNIPTRKDGEFYASHREPDDPGVAVYFQYKGKDMCFACDKHPTVRENLHAIAATLNALRGIERWGASDMMERAFTGFAKLPPAPWRSVLQLGPNATRQDVETSFRRLAMERHPDRGGDDAAMAELNNARRQALQEIGGGA